MNKFKMAFALLAVLVILAAPAYAQPASFRVHAAAWSLADCSCPMVLLERLETAAEFSETLYVEGQT